MTYNRIQVFEYYLHAKAWVQSSPYAAEIIWQDGLDFDDLSESQFLCELAWVVLNSGFRESVVRKYFNYIALCYLDWESSESIIDSAEICTKSAYSVFKNIRKLNAIVDACKKIHIAGFDNIKDEILLNPIPALKKFPFIGDVTAWHLAKNIGLNVAKPDRHLFRLARRYGFDDAHTMCREISEVIGDKISVADLVLWRFEERNAVRFA